MIFGWLGLTLLTMTTGSIATAAVPIGTTIPKSIAIVGTSGPFIIVQSDDPQYVLKLYKSGAYFVIPARKKTCLNLQNPDRSN
jgi:hypothetical protein